MANLTKTKPKKKSDPRAAREDLFAKARDKAPADPLAAFGAKKLALRVGIPALIIWAIALLIPGWIPKVVAGVLTLAVLGLIVWVLRFARKSRKVSSILREAGTANERKEAIQKLEADFKKGDVAAVFAKAQLQMQEDPRLALRTLETINLEKVMAPMADEARSQRAMIHLVLGETDEARALADRIDLKRHKEPRVRASIAAIVGESWARTGQAKRAVELLQTFDPNDEAYGDVKPQLLRSRAFAYAWANDLKRMKQTLRALMAQNPQLLSGFVTKKKHPMGVSPRGVHPLLEKEALEMMSRAGGMPRKMEFRRG